MSSSTERLQQRQSRRAAKAEEAASDESDDDAVPFRVLFSAAANKAEAAESDSYEVREVLDKRASEDAENPIEYKVWWKGSSWAEEWAGGGHQCRQ